MKPQMNPSPTCGGISGQAPMNADIMRGVHPDGNDSVQGARAQAEGLCHTQGKGGKTALADAVKLTAMVKAAG
jgi:hypothetical protein